MTKRTVKVEITREVMRPTRIGPPLTIADVGARPGETMRAYCARLAACPKCGSDRGVSCKTKSGRNHHERIWGPEGSVMRELELLHGKVRVGTEDRAK